MAFELAQARNSWAFKRIAEYLRDHRELTALREQVKEERRQLAELDDRSLLDMGITREQALRESSRAYEDISAKRLRFWMCCN